MIHTHTAYPAKAVIMATDFVCDHADGASGSGTGTIIAAAMSPEIAERIAQLLERHGLVDVPDDVTGAECPWPPPTGQREPYGLLVDLPQPDDET